MSVEQLNEIKQQLSTLTAAEKHAPGAFLIAQANQDAATASNGGAALNEPDPSRELEMRWLREHREEYAGQYVALWRDQLVAHGTDSRKVLAEARAAGFPRALLSRVEALDELPFGGW